MALGGGGVHMSEAQTLGYVGVCDSPVDADGSAVRHRPRGEGEGLPSLAQGEGVGGGVDEHGDGANGREGHLVVER